MSKTKVEPLDDLETHDLLRLICPEHIRSDEDEYFELSCELRGIPIDLGDGFELTLAEFLARIVHLAMPMKRPMTGKFFHCLGEVSLHKGELTMAAAVKREYNGKE